MPPVSIGPYKIERELGRGGMGEVFLAIDTRLDRQVAIKALPEHLAADAVRLARFEREAKLLASLSHPGIATIHGLEEVAGRRYLILEFVDGPTLAERLADGPIPIEEALTIAKQVAEALEAAHEKGIVHRDLKPANVMMTSAGVVKVLDFGLARTEEPTASSSAMRVLADSPTVATPPLAHSPTIPGVIMGTAGYMSPEQARGKAVDKRSDIFSFGCVLYEMLTGSMPFRGETAADSIGATLHKESDFGLLPPQTPIRVREMLSSCLAKDRKNRLHDIGDARLTLERAIAGREWVSTQATGTTRSKAAPIAALVGLAMLGTGWGLAKLVAKPAAVPPAQTFHVSTVIDAKPAFNSLVAIAPDAKFLVYVGWPDLPPESVKPFGNLMLRRLDRDETIAIEGTEGAREAALSPDGRWIAFAAANDRAGTKFTLKRIALENGRPSGKPETVCDLPQNAPPVLCWASDRDIVFSPYWEPVVFIVSASGGEPREVMREDIPKGIESWGDFRPLLPGKAILATRWSFVGQKIRLNTEVIDLTSGKRTLVFPEAGSAQYLQDESGGWLVAMRNTQTSLVAARFDLASMKTIGEPVTVWSGKPVTGFRLARSGTMAIATRPGEVIDRRLAWIDEKGQVQPIPGMTRSYGQIAVSPDGGRVLASMDTAGSAELISECWVQDIARRTSTRIPIQGAMIGMAWSSDGQRITYGVAKDGGFSLVQRRADGSSEPVTLFTSPDTRTLLVPSVWTPDDKTLAFLQVDMSSENPDVYVLTPGPGGGAGTAKPYVKSPVAESSARFSPDGKWVLFASSASGRAELYIQRFTGDGEADARSERRQISTGGVWSTIPWWSPDGSEIRYVSDNQVMSVQVKLEPTVSASEPKTLYSIKDLKTRDLTFAPDGRLMAVMQGESEQTTAAIGVVVNFADEIRAKMALQK